MERIEEKNMEQQQETVLRQQMEEQTISAVQRQVLENINIS